ncbi:hypothetical protein CPB85DRAFT_1430249 [Mucidula mucida]|nr:hypothetical protein CPB85DRAFT_1430249 [Mucidula mucida]
MGSQKCLYILAPYRRIRTALELSAYRAFDVLFTKTLRWSGSKKLNFTVDLRLFLPPSLDSSPVNLPPPRKELFANPARWHHVTFYNIGWMFSRVSPIEIGELNNITLLDLRETWATTVDGLHEDWAHDYDPVVLKMFSKTPRLRILRFIASSKPMVWDNFHWSQLDVLFLDLRLAEQPIVLVSYHFLAACPQLTHYYEVNGLSFEGSSTLGGVGCSISASMSSAKSADFASFGIERIR